MNAIDIVALIIIVFTVFMGLIGLLDRVRGLVFGLILGGFIIISTSIAFIKVNEQIKLGVNTERSVVLRYINHYSNNMFDDNQE